MPMTVFDRLVGLRLLRVHQFIYELSGGRIGEHLGGAPMLLLRTTGRKTAQARNVALLYHRDGADYVVIGSKGGSDAPPAWLLNLQAAPNVRVQVGARRFPADARVASSGERLRLWPEVTKQWPQFGRYQSQTDRLIPLVILTPIGRDVPQTPGRR
jgi:deazaflavin-dependent oxidoreductase (nitroreductase family)